MDVRLTEAKVYYVDIRLTEAEAKKLHHLIYDSSVLVGLEVKLAEKLRDLCELKRKEDWLKVNGRDALEDLFAEEDGA